MKRHRRTQPTWLDWLPQDEWTEVRLYRPITEARRTFSQRIHSFSLTTPLWRVTTAAETTCTLPFEVTEFFAKVSWPSRVIRSNHLERTAREDYDAVLRGYEPMTLVLTEEEKILYR